MKRLLFAAVAAAAIATDAAAVWRMDPIGWREDGAAFESRSSGFALADVEPGREVEIRVRVTPRSCEGDSYGTVGIAAFSSARDYWCLSLVRGPEHTGSKRFVELGPMAGGQWPSYDLFRRTGETKGAMWDWDRAYDLTLRFSADRIEGEVREADGGALVYRTAFEPAGRPLLPAGAIPALRATGRFKARVEVATAATNEGSATEPPLFTLHSSLVGKAASPPSRPTLPSAPRPASAARRRAFSTSSASTASTGRSIPSGAPCRSPASTT